MFKEIGGKFSLSSRSCTLLMSRLCPQMKEKSGELPWRNLSWWETQMHSSLRFGEDSAEKMVDWAEEHLPSKDCSILDRRLHPVSPSSSASAFASFSHLVPCSS